MFGSTILDVVIGLAFVYFLYGLLVTAINEIIASIRDLRGKTLETAIKRMLTDDDPASSGFADTLFQNFLNHPIIKYLKGQGGKRRPSYIAATDFSKAVVDSLAKMSGIDEPSLPDMIKLSVDKLDPDFKSDTGCLLRSFQQEAGTDSGKFRLLIEQWFGSMMDRTTGWYKRQSLSIAFLIGICIVVVFNASTFEIAGHLMKDKGAREQLAQMASGYLQSHPTTASVPARNDSAATIDSLVLFAANLYKTDINESSRLLGLGWNTKDAAANRMDSAGNVLMNILGWLITALAISFGAPYWFELLSKLVPLRMTGLKPEEKELAK